MTLFLFVILVASVWLRVDGIATLPIGGDEIYTIASAEFALHPDRTALSTEAHETIAWYRATTPFLYLANMLPFCLIENGALASRVVPCVAGLLTLVLVPFLVGKLFGRRAGVAAFLLLALCPQHVGYSRYGRYQALTWLFAALTMLAATTAIRSGRTRRIAPTVVLGLLCIASHLSGILVAGCVIVWWFAVRLRATGFRALAAGSGVLLALLIVGWLGDWIALLGTVVEDFTLGTAHPPSWKLLASAVYNNGLLLAALAVTGAVVVLLRRDVASGAIVAGTAGPMLLFFGASSFLLIGPRFLASAEGGIVLLGALALTPLLNAHRRSLRITGNGLLLVVCLSQIPLLIADRIDGQRYDYVSVREYLLRETRPEDLVFSKSHAILGRYLSRLTQEMPADMPDFERRLESARGVDAWVVLQKQRGCRILPDHIPFFGQWLDEHAELVAEFGQRRPDDAIYRFEIQVYRVRREPAVLK